MDFHDIRLGDEIWTIHHESPRALPEVVRGIVVRKDEAYVSALAAVTYKRANPEQGADAERTFMVVVDDVHPTEYEAVQHLHSCYTKRQDQADEEWTRAQKESERAERILTRATNWLRRYERSGLTSEEELARTFWVGLRDTLVRNVLPLPSTTDIKLVYQALLTAMLQLDRHPSLIRALNDTPMGADFQQWYAAVMRSMSAAWWPDCRAVLRTLCEPAYALSPEQAADRYRKAYEERYAAQQESFNAALADTSA